VSVGGQFSELGDSAAFDVIGRPTIAFVQPNTAENVGGEFIELTCENLGPMQPDSILKVSLGEMVLTNVTRISSNVLQATAPPGAGASLQFSVVTKGGLGSEGSPLFSYA